MSVRHLAALAALICACSSPDASACGPSTAMVTRVLDGDTVELADGEKIRYLLVNSNEVSSDECYAAEARDFNAMLVSGKEISLVYDQECKDRFGRLLAYVSVDGREVNKLLLERGYACVLYIKPNGTDRRAEYEAIEAAARAAGKGMWSACPDRGMEVLCAK